MNLPVEARPTYEPFRAKHWVLMLLAYPVYLPIVWLSKNRHPDTRKLAGVVTVCLYAGLVVAAIPGAREAAPQTTPAAGQNPAATQPVATDNAAGRDAAVVVDTPAERWASQARGIEGEGGYAMMLAGFGADESPVQAMALLGAARALADVPPGCPAETCTESLRASATSFVRQVARQRRGLDRALSAAAKRSRELLVAEMDRIAGAEFNTVLQTSGRQSDVLTFQSFRCTRATLEAMVPDEAAFARYGFRRAECSNGFTRWTIDVEPPSDPLDVVIRPDALR